ncbi:MAG TPA: GNAT family N-acyltransferase [Terriglobales bacterium]|nr:GNAT family N-acyltransferase [Terriglobales bacterium]
MPLNHSSEDQAPPEVLSRVAGFPGLAAKFAPVNKVRDLYKRVQQSPDGFLLENLLTEMRVGLRFDAADQQRIPATGPVVVVANHPYGMLDGAILATLLTRVRPDVKVLTNFLLGDVPELQQHCIFVDPFRTGGSGDSNRRALRQSLAWLRQGGMLAIFPAGEVSQWQMPAAQIADPEWNDTAVRLIRKSKASALPVYFCGHNSVGFQLLGMSHPRLRAAFLLQEFLQQEGKMVEVRIGGAVAPDAIAFIAEDQKATEYLRWRTYLLSRRAKPEVSWPAALRSIAATNIAKKIATKLQEPLTVAACPEILQEEIRQLPAGRCLAHGGDLAVYLGAARELPHLLHEIGRLRELTFRQVGEGTGKSLDLDRFDDYYDHLLLWHKAKRELIGAYRAGSTAQILPQHGIGGLYTSTLFRYDERFFQKLGPALELGRSFIRPEYQRQYAPLLLLWKGIAGLVARRPEIPVLFGAVSISNDYNQASREMIYRFFEERMKGSFPGDDLSELIAPRRPFRLATLGRRDYRGMGHALRDLDELSQPIADVECDGKGLPILLRQYAKIGGKLISFNVDRKFSDVLDGLVVVDLRRTDASVLDRYMGRESADRFRAMHSAATVH